MSRNMRIARLGVMLAVTAVFCAVWPSLRAQESTSGSVSGAISDPRGASVPDAQITLTNRLTGAVSRTTTSPAGTYTFRDLFPGEYVLHVEAKGFQPADLLIRIQAGTTATGDLRLQRLPEHPGPALVNTEIPSVQGTIAGTQMDRLPNNRNSLDLAYLQPGVQVFDGQTLSASKSGFYSISIEGRNGRTPRMQIDGVEVNDETIGGTTQNAPLGAVQELQIGQSTLPPSSGLSAEGLVNVVTDSGTNDLHGELFGNFRNKSLAMADFSGGQGNSFSREVFGGSAGGALRKDKLFFFLSGEYFKQDMVAPVLFNSPFSDLNFDYHSPFRDTQLEGRLDYRRSQQSRLFYRFTYDNIQALNSFPENNFQVFKNGVHTPGHGLGFDFTRGKYTHSFRFGYNRFSNSVADAANPSNVFNPAPGISLNFTGGSGFASGPNPFAPQNTIQANEQVRYDGTRPVQAHTFRFGASLNRINALVLANYFGVAPLVGTDTTVASSVIAAAGPFPGGGANPLNYPAKSIILGNGLGCLTENSAFDSRCGSITDTRLHGYLGDTWKVRSNLNVTLALQYVRDTGRTDSDLSTIPCSAASSFGSLAPCSGSDNLLSHFGQIPGLGDPVRQPNLNFAPQFGIVWDPGKAGKTVLHAGIGLYYDDSLFQNVLYDRASRRAQGAFHAESNDPCASHGVVIFPGNVPVSTIDGLDLATQICGNPAGSVATQIADLQSAYQTASAALSSTSPNPNFVGQTLSSRALFAPNFQTPRTVQMNLGFHHQVGQNSVFGFEYLRSVGTHYLLGADTNHVGGSSFLQTTDEPCSTSPTGICHVPRAALNAINSTIATNPLSASVCTPATSAGASSQSAVACYMATVPTATIADFAAHGLDSGSQFLGGLPASIFGLDANHGAAFAGVNPLIGRSTVFFPAGRSLYSGLQLFLRTDVGSRVRGVNAMHLDLAYTHSSFRSNVAGGIGDQDLLPLAADFNHPTAFFGSSSQDRKHLFSLATTFEVRRARLSLVGHFASPLPQTLFLPASNLPGEIFRTDATGDGAFGGQTETGNNSFGDILPGTNIGAFGRSVKAGDLNKTIQNYNSTSAGQPTSAGRALVSAGLLSTAQLQQLGATLPNVQSAPPGNASLSWLRTFDLMLSFPLKVGDRLTLEPQVSAFNILNYANFDSTGMRLGGILNGLPGEANGTTTSTRTTTRILPGSGVFTQAAPRQVELGVKIIF
jgi:Carboxypeptidase regulatory-like domain